MQYSKADLVNLYINPEHYNTDYNFYNYHKFKSTGVIHVIYKTPSIFLNGLYFELPYVQILEVYKKPGSASFEMKLCINKDDLTAENPVLPELFSRIDKFNTHFFTENASKFEIKTNQTNKNSLYIKKVIHGDECIETSTNMPRFRNPFLKKYEYNSFMSIDNDKQFYITVEIKHIYLLKICELIKANQHLLSGDSNTKLITFANQVIQFINQEFFEFRKSSYSYNLKMEHVDLNMKFWIKSNSFEIKNNNLEMIWKICGYQI
jgi:hypothetical protein